MWSDPWVRAVATSRARPVLASQAEKARRSKGAAEKVATSDWSIHSENAKKSDSIIPSRQRSTERRWVRWNTTPVRQAKNAMLKLKCAGVIRETWILTIIV